MWKYQDFKGLNNVPSESSHRFWNVYTVCDIRQEVVPSRNCPVKPCPFKEKKRKEWICINVYNQRHSRSREFHFTGELKV